MKIILSLAIACASSLAIGQTPSDKGLLLDKRLPDFSRLAGPAVVVASNTVYNPVFDLPRESASKLKPTANLSPALHALQTPQKASAAALTPLQPVAQPGLESVAPVLVQPAAVAPVIPTAAVEAAPTRQVKRYELRTSDLTIRAALERWLKADAYQDIVWDLREDLAIDRDAYFEDDLQGAITSVMVALRNTQLPTRACVYSNKVVRVIPATRFCNESTQ